MAKAPVHSWLVLLCALLAFSLGGGTSFVFAEQNQITIITSVPPHAGAVEEIAGKDVRVISMVGQGSDPHTYEPTPKQILAISNAQVYFTAGLEFERRLVDKVSSLNKKLTIIALEEPEESDHDTQDHNGHAHEDLHTWLSPDQFLHQVDIIFETLGRLFPEKKGYMGIRYSHFREKLTKSKLQARQLLAPYNGRVFYVFHPAFGHFGEAFGLLQEAVEVGSKKPSARQIQRIITKARADKVTTIFSQPQFDQRSIQVIAAAIGGEIIILDPLEKDVISNYGTIARSLAKAFQ